MASISQYYFNHDKFEKSIEDFFGDKRNKFVCIESAEMGRSATSTSLLQE
jgi:hypothetical protein